MPFANNEVDTVVPFPVFSLLISANKIAENRVIPVGWSPIPGTGKGGN